eukprot:32440_1
MTTSKKNTCNKQLSFIALCLTAFFATIFVNYLSTTGALGTPNQKELSDKYHLPITPPGYVFSIWGLIYIWQLSWQLYVLYHSIKFSHELQSEGTVSFGVLFYVSWIASCVFNMAWIVLFGFEYITLSGIVLVFITISLYMNAYISHKYMFELAQKSQSLQIKTQDTQFTSVTPSPFPDYLLISQCRRVVYRVLINNGVAFYAGWCSVASCLNFGLFLAFPCDVDQYIASVAALSVLSVILLAYLSLDFYALKRLFIYTYSPYVVLLWALSGILTNEGNNDGDLKGASQDFVMVLLVVVGVAFVGKIICGIVYWIGNKKKQETENDNRYYCLH